MQWRHTRTEHHAFTEEGRFRVGSDAVCMRHWPITDLSVRTQSLVLRLPTLIELDRLSDVAAGGVFPDNAPHGVPFSWHVADPSARARAVLQHAAACIGRWAPEHWTLSFVVFNGDEPIGVQDLTGEDFALRREIRTGSWLGLPYQGRGYGTEMRAGALALARELGGVYATSEAHTENIASSAVSEKLGYQEDGVRTCVRRGQSAVVRRFRLDLRSMMSSGPVCIEGLERARPLFGCG